MWKVSLDGGFGCPHAGACGGGCIFCNVHSFSPSRRMGPASVGEQLAAGIARLGARGAERFVAYFQPGTNTWGTPERLRALYDEALANPQVVGLAVGTRPDCAADPVLDLLAEFARRTWVSLEFGVQTIHERSLQWLRRGHGHAATVDAIERSRARGLEVGAHVILGIPGETCDDVRATADELARLGVASVKLHNLYAVNETPLGALVERGEVRLIERDEYVALAVDFLERLPPECVIDRLSGDAPREFFIGPAWCLDKAAVRRAIEAEFARRGTRQGAARSSSPVA